MQRTSVIILLLCALVLAPSLAIRLWPVTSESFSADAISSQLAAGRGFVANAMDRENVLIERRAHPPLLSYIILLNNRIFGDDPFRARIFSAAAGALCCLVVSLSLMRMLAGLAAGPAAAIFGGLMLALLPVHIYVSRTANWDAVYSLFAMCALMFLSLRLARPSRASLVFAGVFAGFALLTSEAGLLLAPVFLFVLFRDLRRSPPRSVMGNWGIAALSFCILLVLLWPAAIVKLDLTWAVVLRIRDNANSVRNHPWHGFYTELFRQSPAFVVAAALGLASLAISLPAARGARDELRERLAAVYTMLIPFALYAAVVFALSFTQRLVYVHHIADMLPPLSVILAGAAVVGASLVRPRARGAIVLACALLLILSAPPVIKGDPEVVGPQEHPGFLGVRDFLKEHPDARTYYHYSFHMSYYLPGARIEGDRERHWTAERIERVKGASYDFIVADYSMFSDAYPDIGAVSAALEPEYVLVHTVHHLRTKAPVAWMFGRSRDSLIEAAVGFVVE